MRTLGDPPGKLRSAAITIVLLWSCASLGLVRAGVADRTGYDPAKLLWSGLSYRASKLGITFHSEIRLKSVAAAQAVSGWRPCPEGAPLSPMGSEVLLMTVGSSLLGRQSTLDLWFDPSSTAAYHRVQLETGRKTQRNRHRSLRYTDRGVCGATTRPEDGELDKPYTQWSRSDSAFMAYPDARALESVVTEPSALFYILATADLATRGDRLSTFIYSKSQLMRARLDVDGLQQLGVDYLVSTPLGEHRVRGTVPVLRITVDGDPVEASVADSDFEFLGLRGKVTVFLDPEVRVPVQVSGNIKYAGKGDVRLQRVVLR